MNNSVKLPVYLKLSQIILGLLALFYILYIGQGIIVPLVFSVLIAILLNPVVNYLTNRKMNRLLAIFITLMVACIVLLSLAYFIGSQINMFSETFGQFMEKFTILFNDTISWISETFNISKTKINIWIENMKGQGLNSGTAFIGQTIGTIGDILVITLLIPVYVFMILFYKPLLLDFISQLFKRDKHYMVTEVLTETKSLIQNYLIGLMIEALLVAILNSVGLLIIGIDYAILLGIIGALLNIIPYLGGLIAALLSMIIAFATKSPTSALTVLGMFIFVQFLDNNFIVPRIVASKVKINALVSIIVVLVGGALWGIPGMFLSIPLTAIVKVIFDRITPLKPFGFLLGDDQPEIGKLTLKFTKPKIRKSD